MIEVKPIQVYFEDGVRITRYPAQTQAGDYPVLVTVLPKTNPLTGGQVQVGGRYDYLPNAFVRRWSYANGAKTLSESTARLSTHESV